MNQALTALIAIQQKDTQIRTLSDKLHRLTDQHKKIEATLATEEKSEAAVKEKFADLRRKSQERSAQADDLDIQIRKYQKQLDDGLVSFKEMESLRQQMQHNRELMEKAEEEAITLLDQVQSEMAKLKEREASYQHWKSRIEEEMREVDEETAQIRQKIAIEVTERTRLLESLDPVFLAKYQGLSKSLEQPLASVRDGRCTGCSLPLSQTTIERVREGLDLVTCENCSRILHP
ncbi:hypothetical protein HY229_07170 [Candidatus Acetothermia bacterium]|nr:hypothetical protein [Candidatus Acetothermia bacterium]MBI3643859.1 hypothetical protein [Candidatus Acetothermia bacterium]